MDKSQPTVTTFDGRSYVNGVASGRLLASTLELSFWGGVNPQSGEVIDRFHPLSGHFLKDAILAIPGSRGSCGGSVVIMELLLNGLGPRALIFERCDETISLGVIIAEEFFGKSIPVLSLNPREFCRLVDLDGSTVHVYDNQISVTAPLGPTKTDAIENLVGPADSLIQLSASDRAILEGSHGKATAVAMKIIIRMARMIGAAELIDVRQAHVDGAWYGPGSLAFGERLRDWGGKFRVPATMNSLNIDRKRWQSLGVSTELGSVSERLTQAFLDMGGRVSFTCAPYLLDSAPTLGEAVAWGESNAVIYANSVLGARTLKNPNMLECLIALTGRAPKAGVYTDQGRLASIWIKVPFVAEVDDSFWPVLGYSIGAKTGSQIPAITGLEHLQPTRDDLKAFSAAFATTSSAAMYHMIELTQEASTLQSVYANYQDQSSAIPLDWKDIYACWHEFNHGSAPRRVDLISLGNPHFSCAEIKKLAQLCQGRTKHKDIAIIITCGRAQYGLASQAGHVASAEEFGCRFLTDTCWCSIEEPIIPTTARVIMTNSGKYVHYGPGLTGRQFCFGSLAECVEAACTGWTQGQSPSWLKQM